MGIHSAAVKTKPTIATSDFEYICELIRTKSGIVLETGKEYLVEARLTALIRQQKIDSLAIDAIQQRKGEALSIEVAAGNRRTLRVHQPANRRPSAKSSKLCV